MSTGADEANKIADADAANAAWPVVTDSVARLSEGKYRELTARIVELGGDLKESERKREEAEKELADLLKTVMKFAEDGIANADSGMEECHRKRGEHVVARQVYETLIQRCGRSSEEKEGGAE